MSQGPILGSLLFNISVDDIFFFLTTCTMCNYTDDNTLHPYSKDFHQVQKYLKKDCEMIENWFYVNRMYVNPNKCEIMNFGKTKGNEVFTYIEIGL